jgi:hypothetical protein
MGAVMAELAGGCPLGSGCDCGLHGYILSLHRSPRGASEEYWIDDRTPVNARTQARATSGALSDQFLDSR